MELNWKFDIPNNKLFLHISDDLNYVAIKGAKEGIIKTFKGQESTISYEKWPNEKVWIDNNYSDIVGDLTIPTLKQQEEYMDKWRPFIGNPVPPTFGISEDGQRIYLVNITFDEDTFDMRLVRLDRKGKKSWEDEYIPINIPGVELDGRNLELHMNLQEDVITVSMSPTFKSQNEDLYVSLKQGDGSWGKLINLGSTINTNRFEITPFLSADKKKLYFTSNGHDGYGRGDIFVSTRLDDSWQKWTRPLNLGEPINSKDFEGHFMISEKNDVYFVSDRASEFNDIFYTRSTGKFIIPNLDSTVAQFFFKQLSNCLTDKL